MRSTASKTMAVLKKTRALPVPTVSELHYMIMNTLLLPVHQHRYLVEKFKLINSTIWPSNFRFWSFKLIL